MGYRTYFEIEVIKDGITDQEIQQHYDDISELADDRFDEHGRTEEDISWYDYEEDMRAHSLKHPNTLFKMHGQGEENDDMWKAYFLNGKMQSCPAIITFDEFDESKLK